MPITAKLLALAALLPAFSQVLANDDDDDQAPKICFFSDEDGANAKHALCCDGRGQVNECCGMSSADWRKDISAEETAPDKAVKFYRDDKGVDVIASGPIGDRGNFHASWLSDYDARPNLNLEKCSVRYGDLVYTRFVEPRGGRLRGRMANSTQQCWDPDHVKWTDPQDKVWWANIKFGNLQEVMEALECDNFQKLASNRNRYGQRLFGAVQEFSRGPEGQVTAPQQPEQYSDSSNMDSSEGP